MFPGPIETILPLVTSVALQSIVQAESIVSPDGREECNGVILLLDVFDVVAVSRDLAL